MREDVENFFSRLQTVRFKPLGYKKQRHTFSRDGSGFTERVQFQGSAWNDRNRPWRFYVNFGIQFHGLAPRNPDRDLPGTHCWARIDHLVPGAPKEFDVIAAVDSLAAQIAALVEQASRRVVEQLDALRECYEAKRTPRLSFT